MKGLLDEDLRSMSYKQIISNKDSLLDKYRSNVILKETYDSIVKIKNNFVVDEKLVKKNEWYEQALILAISDILAEKTLNSFSENPSYETATCDNENVPIIHKVIQSMLVNFIGCLSEAVSYHAIKIIIEKQKDFNNV